MNNHRRPTILFLIAAFFLSSCTQPGRLPAQPSGSAVLYLQRQDTFIRNLSTGETTRLATGLIPQSWSPSGILLKGESMIQVFPDMQTTEPATISLESLACPQLEEAVWLNDSVLMHAGSGSRSCLYLYSVEQARIIHTELDYEGFDLLPSPDGRFWIQRTLDGLELRNVSGQRVMLPDIHSGYKPGIRQDLAFSPDGTELAYFSGGAIWKADIDIHGLHDPMQLYQPSSFLPDLSWSPDGGLLAFLEYDEQDSRTLLQVINADTGDLLYSRDWPGRGSQLLWGPSSNEIMSHAGAPFSMDIETGAVSYPFGENPDDVILLYDWHASGK